MEENEMKAKRRRLVKSPGLDLALAEWIRECNQKNVPIKLQRIKDFS